MWGRPTWGLGKAALETVRVARAGLQIGTRNFEKAGSQVIDAGEELLRVGLRSPPAQDFLGRHQTAQVWDSYAQVKEFLAQSAASFSHHAAERLVQSGAESTSALLREAGIQARVIGPFDEHWATIRVLEEIRAASEGRRKELRSGRGGGVYLTPKRFVYLMREAAAKMKRRQNDPVEVYVNRRLDGGLTASLAPAVFERKLYTDVMRVTLFLFDQALQAANGLSIWGHELCIEVLESAGATGVPMKRRAGRIRPAQVEAAVERMLQGPELGGFLLPASVQQRLLTNCCLLVLDLVEDLTSEQQMRVSVLGHALRLRLDPFPVDSPLHAAAPEREAPRAQSQDIEELVEALLDEPELGASLVPDAVEAMAYRRVLKTMIQVLDEVLGQLRVRLLGVEVRLRLASSVDAADSPSSAEVAGGAVVEKGMGTIRVTAEDIAGLLKALGAERWSVRRELEGRERRVHQFAEGASHDAKGEPGAVDASEKATEGELHEFHTLAAQERLARCFSVRCVIRAPIDVPFSMLADPDTYPEWMPMCTTGSSSGARGGPEPHSFEAVVGFGLDTGTMLGTLGDSVHYTLSVHPPAAKQRVRYNFSSLNMDGNFLSEEASGSATAPPGSDEAPPGAAARSARIVADAKRGFAYGDRLIYDWCFTELRPGETDVRLDLFFQAKSVIFLPLWDSMQAMISDKMMVNFAERAAQLSRERGSM